MRPSASLSGALDPRSLARLRAILGTDASFQGILRDFLLSSASIGAEFRLGMNGGRLREVGRAAHTLKSMARLLGAAELGETCRQVEALAHGPAPVPPPLLHDAIVRLDATRTAVESLLV